VHEAKGLEYPHVVLFNLVSGQRQAFTEVCRDVTDEDLADGTLEYRRAKDKSDKSLELFKFYINALYVAMTRAVISLTVVESDTSHPLLILLGLKEGEVIRAPAVASTREEWAQEAHKLELQGKKEQAQAIRDTFLQFKPVPWIPWSQTQVEQWAAMTLERSNPSVKPKQAILDYAIWHEQQTWIDKLAISGFGPARVLSDAGTGGPAFFAPGYELQQRKRQQQQLTIRNLGMLRQRYLQPYAAKNTKELLRLADVHGVDHRTPVGATPLMLAAQAGNAQLVQAFLERGADPTLRDEFGYTPWLYALAYALEDNKFAGASLAAMFELLGPAVIDVQSANRLIRLESKQGEYWVLMMMLVGLKKQWSVFPVPKEKPFKYNFGFCAEQLEDSLAILPEWMWPEKRRKRTYVNAVLARAELSSQYTPSRQLWVRSRTGYYLPNPTMKLRSDNQWKPVYEVMNLAWIDVGCPPAKRPDTPNPLDMISQLMVGAT
jgi:hypothetical protein